MYRKHQARKKNKHKGCVQNGTGAENTTVAVHSQDMPTSVEDVPIKAIVKYRLTAEQIKEIPHFANYSCGDPHHVSDRLLFNL